jgi:hypothetical protein
MIFKPSSPIVNKHLSYKLCKLLSFLNYTTAEYEKIAAEIKNNDEKMALLSIAAQTNQYATEISSQLRCLDIPYLSAHRDFDYREVLQYVQTVRTLEDKHNLSAICYEKEHSLVDIYRDILQNEYIPFPFLKQMITHQFTGVKLAFMKMRLFDFLQFGGLQRKNNLSFQFNNQPS